jgi:hypothetical protein
MERWRDEEMEDCGEDDTREREGVEGDSPA